MSCDLHPVPCRLRQPSCSAAGAGRRARSAELGLRARRHGAPRRGTGGGPGSACCPRALGAAAESKEPIDTFAFPGIWNGKVVAGKKLPAHGYATFALRILLPAAGSYGIKHKMASAASVLWVNDRILTKAGHVATSPSEYREHGMAQVGYFDATQPVVDLTLQLASFGFFRGGPRAPMLFGTAQQVQRQRERPCLARWRSPSAASASASCSSSCFCSVAASARRFTSASSVCSTPSGGHCRGELILTQLLPQVPYDWMRKLEYVLLSLMTPIFLWFFDSLYPGSSARDARDGLCAVRLFWRHGDPDADAHLYPAAHRQPAVDAAHAALRSCRHGAHRASWIYGCRPICLRLRRVWGGCGLRHLQHRLAALCRSCRPRECRCWC